MAGEETRSVGMGAETEGPVGGEMAVDHTTRGDDSRLHGDCRAGTTGHCAHIFHLLPGLDPRGSTLLCAGGLTTWTAWVGTLALCLGAGNHGDPGRRCKEGER